MTAFRKVIVTLRNQHQIGLYNARCTPLLVRRQATDEAGNGCAQFQPGESLPVRGSGGVAASLFPASGICSLTEISADSASSSPGLRPLISCRRNAPIAISAATPTTRGGVSTAKSANTRVLLRVRRWSGRRRRRSQRTGGGLLVLSRTGPGPAWPGRMRNCASGLARMAISEPAPCPMSRAPCPVPRSVR